MLFRDPYQQLMSGVDDRARAARKHAWRLPRRARQKFIYDHTFRNDIEAVAYPLARDTGTLPDLANPQTFPEITRSLYLTHPNPLMPIVADKASLDKVSAYFDTPIRPLKKYAVYEDPTELDVSTLPETCYLKITDSSKMNMLHARGMPVTPVWYRIMLWDWWHLDHWRRHAELHYRDIPKRMLVEEVLPAAPDFTEIEIFCAMGEPYIVNVHSRAANGDNLFKGYVPLGGDYEKLAKAKSTKLPQSAVGTPEDWDAVMETARRLSAPFLQCRVDFMRNAERVVLCEVTLTPGALEPIFGTPGQNHFRGELLDIGRLDDLLVKGRQIAQDLGWPVETSFGHFKDDPRLATGGQ